MAFPLIAVLIVAVMLCERAASASLIAADPAIENLARAVERTPSDPTLQEVFGLSEARSAARLEYADDAFVHIVRSLELRPVSPYAWAAYAEARYRAGVADETFETALVNAAELGPHEPQVQETVAFYGLAVWNEVKPTTRAAIERMVAAGVKRDPATLMQVAERRGRLAIACRHVGATSRLPDKWAQLCKSTEAT